MGPVTTQANSQGDVFDDFKREVEGEREESPLPNEVSLQEGATFLGIT